MEQKENMLATESIGKLLFKLSLPAITAQVINALYNIVDRIFIGHLPEEGSLALAALGVSFPLIMIISAFSALIGMGGAPRASIAMGAGKKDDAEKILGNSFTTLLIMSAILTLVFFVAKDPLLMMFGATEKSLPYASRYFSIYLCGTVSVQLALGLNMFISSQGFATVSMMTVLIGAICNIILDPILIYGLNMGVQGAALATVISQTISAFWVLKFLLGKKTILHIRKKYMKPEKAVLLPIIALGVSPFIMQSTESLVQLTFNVQIKRYGGENVDVLIGAMSILLSTMQFMTLPTVGLTQGSQPIISYNYGAGKIARVKKAFRLLLTIALTYTTICWLLCLLIPQVFAMIFSPDPELIQIATRYLPIFMFGMLLMGAQFSCQQTFVALGQAKVSMFLALLRKIILLIPLTFIFPIFAGLNGIFFSEPVADILAATTTSITFYIYSKKLLREPPEKDQQI